MDKMTSERRRTLRRQLRIRVRLYNDETGEYENAHLENINYTGMYLITRRKLAINQGVEVLIPSETHEDPLTIKAKVIRQGNHRSWGLFSYACSIIHSN